MPIILFEPGASSGGGGGGGDGDPAGTAALEVFNHVALGGAAHPVAVAAIDGEGGANGFISAEDQEKLNEIAAGAQVNPQQISTEERTFGDGVDLRSYAPIDIAIMIDQHNANLPAQVSEEERAAGTATDIRLFSPADIKAMILAFASSGGDMTVIDGGTP